MFSEYYDGELGGLCNDESHVIRTQSECTIALQQLGYQSTGNYWSDTKSTIPSGCSIKTSSNEPHLETSPTGLGKGRNDLVPICIIPGNTGDSNRIRLLIRSFVALVIFYISRVKKSYYIC